MATTIKTSSKNYFSEVPQQHAMSVNKIGF